ncbi:MAG: zinc ribbon domain-containing protein [Proteobacteria bacterium]|nr:zinc ribbon domain-containing protein [Desulfobulbaceae bacterium]MBU4153288.1 zinc ribbon domain-containing protein [Pseudomonadota bacterium]
MPIYEYQCDKCQQLTEAWQSLADEPLTTCQSCSGSLKKIISMSSFHLKGGGWYADSYNGSSNQKSCSSANSCPAKETTPATSTSDTKPACSQSASCNASATAS